MKKEKQHNKKTLLLLIVLIGTMFASFSLINTDFKTNNSKANDLIVNNDTTNNIETETPRLAAYSTDVEGEGVDIDISLHQSNTTTGSPLFQINASDSNNNTFSSGNCPTDVTFNSTRTQIIVEDIYAPDKTIEIETNKTNYNDDSIETFRATSFNTTDCDFKLTSASFYLGMTGNDNTIYVYLLNSTVSGNTYLPVYDSRVLLNSFAWDPPSGDKIADLGDYSVDHTKTIDNVWFLGLFSNSIESTDDVEWRHIDDSRTPPLGNGDNSEAYTLTGPDTWNPANIDYISTVNIAPINNTAKPLDINLQINNSLVNNYINVNGSGYWEYDNEYNTLPNKFNFTLTSSWWDVECNITKIQVNYTKTDILAYSNFTVTAGADDVYWNVTRQGLTYFEAGFENYQINYTIPTRWTDIQVWNGGTESSITTSTLNGYKHVRVMGASNGDNWFLNATSPNVIQSIQTYVDGTTLDKSEFLFMDIVEINATSSVNINNGFLNLTIYNNTAPNTLKHSRDSSSFDGGMELNFDTWDIKSKIFVSEYGKLKIQTLWNNGTDAGFEEKIITIIGNTDLALLNENDQEYMEKEKFNVTVFYNDTGGENIGIPNAIIYNNSQIAIPSLLKTNGTDGYYFFEINTTYYAYGLNTIIIGANKTYYENQTKSFTFFKVMGTQILPTETSNYFQMGSVYRSQNVSLTFNYTTVEGVGIDGATWKEIEVNNFDASFSRDGNGNYTVDVNTSLIVNGGNFDYKFNITKSGNETQIITLNITVYLPNTKLEFTLATESIQVALGKNLTLEFNFTKALSGGPILTLDTDNVTVEYEQTDSVWVEWNYDFKWILINHNDGNYTLNISTTLTPEKVYRLRITIIYSSPNPGPYNDSITYISFTYGSGGGNGGTTPPPGDDDDDDSSSSTTTTTGIPVLYIIIFVVIVGLVGAIVGVQKGLVAPKKRKRQKILLEASTIIDDAVNTEHTLVMYKGTGTCIFFKSFGFDEIDPELISGFLTAVSSFGREMDSQESLNQIQYGDKTLLLTDGEYIRVALVLEKEASIILRQHLKEFIEVFERVYAKHLPKWKGQLDIFRGAGTIVDEVFHTSIILPHKIDFSKSKGLKNQISKTVLNQALELIKKSKDRQFFFIASLVGDMLEEGSKDRSEIFIGINELREKGVFKPIEIQAAESDQISQQELDIIRQKINAIGDLTEEEVNRIVNELAHMSPVEREAYISSVKQKDKIVSAPVKTKSGTKVIDNEKAAKKEVGVLKKTAKQRHKQGKTEDAIEMYKNASLIAQNWDLPKEFEDIENTIRLITINVLKKNIKILEDKAKKAVKVKNYAEASQDYEAASKMAGEAFKFGEDAYGKEEKRLINKAKEFKKFK